MADPVKSENDKCYCPWCGGSLDDKGREIANRLRERMNACAAEYLSSEPVGQEVKPHGL
jgi:transposase